MKTKMSIATFMLASLISLASCVEEDPTPQNPEIPFEKSDTDISQQESDSGLKVPSHTVE